MYSGSYGNFHLHLLSHTTNTTENINFCISISNKNILLKLETKLNKKLWNLINPSEFSKRLIFFSLKFSLNSWLINQKNKNHETFE